MEEMEENRKRPGGDKAEEVTEKRARTPATSEETDKAGSEDDDITAWWSIDNEEVNELAKLLETEVTSPVKVKFIDDPYSSPLIFQSSSSYITINGNEESCGSSFSDWDSSVMACIDMGGINIHRRDRFFEGYSGWFPAADGGALGFDGEVASGRASVAEGCEVKGTNGSDCSDFDDEMLARFLGEDLFE